MAGLFDRIGSIRSRLRHPRANRPGEEDCLRALCDHVKLLRAKRRNTGHPWDIADKEIHVKGGTAKYQIADVRFGVPLAVLTRDDSNPNHIQRIVPFYAPANLAWNWGLPNNSANYMVNPDGSTHTADRVAFYWVSGTPYLEFQPLPASNAIYVVRFLVGDTVDAMSLSDPIALGEVGDSLSEIRAAMSLLPFADYFDKESDNQTRRRELKESLIWESSLMDEQFSADAQVMTASTLGHLWMPDE